MKEFNYLKERNRMTKNCNIQCKDCPLSAEKNKSGLMCTEFERIHPSIAYDIVKEWSINNERMEYKK